MKKTLAIVLALVMVLAMIPAMGAAVTETKTINDKAYTIDVRAVKDTAWVRKENTNTVELKYNWEKIGAEQTGKWTEDAKMGELCIIGWDEAFKTLTASDVTVTVDGMKLELAVDADKSYNRETGCWNGTGLTVPVELTKAGYTDTYVIQMSATNGDKKITETAKVTLKCINTAEYKDVKTAVITNVASKAADKLDAYIVGSKIYLDYVKDDVSAENIVVKFTFADENKAAFSALTYAYDATAAFSVAAGDTAGNVRKDYKDDFEGWDGEAVKLESSAANYTVAGQYDAETGKLASDVQFKLETKADLYETKKYDVIVRTGIAKEDPKGIYFAETTKTIAMGETYAPVVVGVKTGKPVAATIVVGEQTDKQVIDIDANGAVVGTREGVAYITAKYDFYTTAGNYKTYESSSMKIIVTLPGESIPALDPSAEVYYVTCRALNVRAGAGTSYKKVDLIHRGDAVKVVELKNGWAKLADGTYVCAKYIAK